MTETKRTDVRLSVRKERAGEVGTCCFCDDEVSEYGVRPNAIVMVVRGERSGITRICSACLTELKRLTR